VFKKTTTLCMALGLAMSAAAAHAEQIDDKVLVTVNGSKLTEQDFLASASREGLSAEQLSTPQQQSALMNSLVNSTLLAAAAEQANRAAEPAVAAALRIARTEVLAQAELRAYAEEHPVTDAEIQAEYDAQFTAERLREYKASHILTEDRATAAQALAEIGNGMSFADAAKQFSTDSNAAQGGELGWFNLSQVDRAFGEAVANMDKGGYSTEPVQTRFGWHLILLEDSRQQPAPALADVETQLRGAVEQKKLMAYLSGLREAADIQIQQPEQAAGSATD
jgi:peptidyl-prolyl cis-trans isomerase C